jgi:negative regulator of flagellin synthesis FlgM
MRVNSTPSTQATSNQDELTSRLLVQKTDGDAKSLSLEKGIAVKISPKSEAFHIDDVQDINVAKVDEIKLALQTGELAIDTKKIAQALLEDAFNLLMSE